MVFDPTRDNVVIKAPWFWQLVLEGEDHFVHKDYDQRHVINSALIFFRPVALMLAFAALWGLCVMQFEMKGINYALVLGINKGEGSVPISSTLLDAAVCLQTSSPSRRTFSKACSTFL
jgi:hypothetical protein